MRRTVDELKELKELKLGILYIGLESGDDEILKRICKNVTSQQVIEAVKGSKPPVFSRPLPSFWVSVVRRIVKNMPSPRLSIE